MCLLLGTSRARSACISLLAFSIWATSEPGGAFAGADSTERQGAERGGSANLFGAGDEINALVILLILYQVLFLYRLRKERSIPITLIFVRSIHEYQTDHFVRIHAGEQSHVESSEGVTDQHIRWSDAGISQQCA